METLEIKYQNGRMVIYVGEFFPCLTKTARKLYALIKPNCPGDVRAELGRHLSLLVVFYRAQVESHGAKWGNVPDDFWPGNYPTRQREREVALKRAEANYKLYCQMEVDDEWMK